MEFRLLTDLRHQDKQWHQSAADTLLFPARKLLEGKRVECIRIHPKSKSDDAILFRGPNHQKNKHILRKIIEKTSLIALAIITLPLMAIALVVKAIGDDRECALFSRYTAAESELKNNFDKYEERDILEDSTYFSLVEKIAGSMNYTNLKQHAHLHADKFMSPAAPTKLCDQIIRRPGRNLKEEQGGLFFITANNIKTYIDELVKNSPKDTDFRKAKKIVDEYKKWSLRMVPLMIPRFIGIHSKGYTHEMALDLKKRIFSLENHDSFLVPVNLRMESGGFHTITIEIGREDTSKGENKYTFKVFNVGAGAGQHKMKGFGFSSSVYPFSVENISLEEVTDLNFLKGFVDQATFRENSTHFCDRFYRFVRKNFGPEKGHVINREGAEDAKRLQQSGTCIFKSPLAALKSTLGTEAYKKVMFHVKLQDWNSLYNRYVKSTDKELTDDYEKGNILAHIAFHNLEKNICKQARRENIHVELLKEKYFTKEQIEAFHTMTAMHESAN